MTLRIHSNKIGIKEGPYKQTNKNGLRITGLRRYIQEKILPKSYLGYQKFIDYRKVFLDKESRGDGRGKVENME